MNKRILYILISGICISLVGIIAVQYLWIRNAFQVKEVQFARSVNDALGSVIQNIETRENMFFISRNYEGDSILSIVQAFTQDTTAIIRNRLDSLLAMNEMPGSIALPPPPPPPQQKRPADVRRRPNSSLLQYSYQYNIHPVGDGYDSITFRMEEIFQEMPSGQPFALSFEWEDQMARLDSIMNLQPFERQQLLSLEPAGAEHVQAGEVIIESPGMHGQQYFRYRVPPPAKQPQIPRQNKENRTRQLEREQKIQKLDNKARKIQEVIKQMAIALETKPAPIQQRINKKSLQATLGKSFKDKGIDLPFEYAVLSPSSDSNHIPIRSDGFKNEYTESEHRVSLFPNDLFEKPDLLLVHFPGQKSHVLKSLSLLLIGSVIFTLVILISSGGSIVVMIRQKKISDIKTDFINNMTHEFKTPIATISIAADSINNPRVVTQPETIRNFTRIIKEENNRMNSRVEQILQMSLLDSRDFKLRPVLIHLNHLVERAVEHYRLQIQSREGTITTRLEAENDMVHADEDHIRNVLMNLLDNANKYSLAKPEIEVFSFNRSGKFFFGVRDKGMGMSKDVQRKVFDKFYRVTSGNIHNIKGFGLGLSYVKAIVLAHHGDIRIESEPGAGTSFEISLPGVADGPYNAV